MACHSLRLQMYDAAPLGRQHGLPCSHCLCCLAPAAAVLSLDMQGAEGEVWLGVDDQTQSMVAVKLIPRGAPAWKLDMARREFSMLAQLGPGHLNIVRPLEVVLTSKKLVLITEYVPGMHGRHARTHAAQQQQQQETLRGSCKARSALVRGISRQSCAAVVVCASCTNPNACTHVCRRLPVGLPCAPQLH